MKTNETKLQRWPRACWRAAYLALWVGACGGTVARGPSVGSESHFLAYCEASCADGLDCIGGICTRSCLTQEASCSDLAANAACTNQSVEPGEVAVCDVSCGGAAGCGALGADYACESGYCRKPRSSGSAGAGGGGPVSGGSAGSSSVTGSIGTPGSGMAGTGSGGGSVPGVDCNPVGRYQVGKEGGYLPCCPGLTQLSTLLEATAEDGTRVCEEFPVNSFSCIQGSCGDGVCEDAEAPCGCGVDCRDSTWRASEATCAAFANQSPPPDVRAISITNTGDVPLYLWPPQEDYCRSATPLVKVERDGQLVNTLSACSDSCQRLLDEGGPASPPLRDCALAECAPRTLVLIQPGQTRQQIVALEEVLQELPRYCAEGITADTEACHTRVIPQPGNYTLTVQAFVELQCASALDCECLPIGNGACQNPNLSPSGAPLVFSFPSTWYFQNQELQISAPVN